MSKTAVQSKANKSSTPPNGHLPLTRAESITSGRTWVRGIHPVEGQDSSEQTSGSKFPLSAGFEADPILAETAHDLNNALGSIRLHLELLESESRSAERVRQRLREIRPAVEYAADMARQLANPEMLDSGALDPHPAREIDLNPVLQRMAPLLAGMLQQNVDLHLRLAPDLGGVMIHPAEVIRIVSNLVLNASAALTGGTGTTRGRVTLETTNWQPAGWVALRVRDTGQGMSGMTRAFIFQPFFTTKRAGEGTGLGLSSVLRLVRRAGGTIHVDSLPDKGTDITILFPSTRAKSPNLVSSKSGPNVLRGRKKCL